CAPRWPCRSRRCRARSGTPTSPRTAAAPAAAASTSSSPTSPPRPTIPHAPPSNGSPRGSPSSTSPPCSPGARDITFSDRFLRDLIQRVPHADVHRFEEASHLVWEDAAVASLVADWLQHTFGTAEQPRSAAPVWRPVSDHAEQAPQRHIGAAIAELANDPRHAHSPAVVELGGEDGETREISWSLLNRRIDDIAAGLLAHGV